MVNSPSVTSPPKSPTSDALSTDYSSVNSGEMQPSDSSARAAAGPTAADWSNALLPLLTLALGWLASRLQKHTK